MSEASKPEAQDNVPVPLFTVQAFDDKGRRFERGDQLAHPRGFIPAEQPRAEQAAKRANQLGLAGVKFKAVPCEETAKAAAQDAATNPGDES